MEDMGLLNHQGWKWFEEEEAQIIMSGGYLKHKLLVLIKQKQWGFGKMIWMLIRTWKECVFRGLKSGTVSLLLVIIWSSFLTFTSISYSTFFFLVLLLTMGAAVHHTPGLLIVGLFAILILWMYANFWMTAGLLFIFLGYVFSLNQARLVILIAAIYALYCLKNQAGWSGVLVLINLAFLSNDAFDLYAPLE